MSEPFTEADKRYMERALELAQRGWGTTHPNPMVGAVIVEDGVIVAEGWHERAGEAHAEKAALASLGRQPKPGATLYVTLEPCSTTGRTGACTDAILRAGIAAVIVGADDPNPAHAGRAYPLLREKGVRVRSGLLATECVRLNHIFNHWIATSRPLVTAKIALTLDGRFATRAGHSRWVTGEAARQDVMLWRRLYPAIAVAAGTVLADDPALTSRLPEGEWCPRRFVLDRHLRTVADGAALPRLYTDDHRSRTSVVCLSGAEAERKARLRDAGVAVVEINDSEAAYGDFCRAFLEHLNAAELGGVWVEAGPRFFNNLLAERLIDYLMVYTAPKLMADAGAPGIDCQSSEPPIAMDDVWQLRDVEHAIFGEDIRTVGKISYENRSCRESI